MEENQKTPISQTPPTSPDPSVSGSALTEKSQSRGKIIGGVVLLLVLLAAFAGYKVYASPARVWQRFMSQPFNSSELIAHETINFAYKDNKEPDSGELNNNPFAGMLSKVGFSVGADFYINGIRAEGPEADGDINYIFSSGGTSFSATLQAMLKAQDLYLRIGNVPLIAGLVSGFSSDEPVDWIKINFKGLQDLAAEENNSGAAMPNLTQDMKKYQDIQAKHWQKMLSMSSVLGSEKIHSVNTTHFANKLDKGELKAMLNEIFNVAFDEAQQMQATSTAEDLTKAKAAVTDTLETIIDRMEIKTFETWIGTADAKLYKLKFSSSAPSLVSLITASDEAGQDPDLAADEQKLIHEILQKVSFEGQFDIDEEFYDYGKVQEVKVPDNALDVVQKIKEQKQNLFQPDPGIEDTRLLQ